MPVMYRWDFRWMLCAAVVASVAAGSRGSTVITDFKPTWVPGQCPAPCGGH